jgi:hypothetical protein
MKESKRYKNSIIQFIQNFKPPSKKGKSDDSSSVGTGVSLDTQDEYDVSEIIGKRIKKTRKPRQKINISSLLSKSSNAPVVVENPESNISPPIVESEQQNPIPTVKAKNIKINIPPSFATSLKAKPKPKSKSKVMSNVELPNSDEDINLSDIPEASEDVLDA